MISVMRIAISSRVMKFRENSDIARERNSDL